MLTDTSPIVPPCHFASAKPAGDYLCHCAKVTEGEVRSAMAFGMVKTLEQVMAVTGAGTGCRACHCRIQRVLQGLPAKCGGRFDLCGQCGCIGAICHCAEQAETDHSDSSRIEAA